MDHLEDRAVPSGDLAKAPIQIESAFNDFASQIRQAELSLAASVNPTNTESTGNIPAIAMGIRAESLIGTLQQSLGSALSGAPTASTLAQGRLGRSGLALELATTYGTAAAGTIDFSIPRAPLPVVYIRPSRRRSPVRSRRPRRTPPSPGSRRPTARPSPRPRRPSPRPTGHSPRKCSRRSRSSGGR